MIKIVEVYYSQLETYLNKNGYTFLCNYGDKFIFKYNDSKKSTELLVNKTFTELIKDNLLIDDFREYGNDIFLKNQMREFYIYRTAKNENGKKEKRQMEKIFDIKQRYRTFLINGKKWQGNESKPGMMKI